MPTQLPPGEYKIRIEGDVGEGRGGSIFSSETQLSFSEKFLSILIQTNRHIYNGEQKSKTNFLFSTFCHVMEFTVWHLFQFYFVSFLCEETWFHTMNQWTFMFLYV